MKLIYKITFIILWLSTIAVAQEKDPRMAQIASVEQEINVFIAAHIDSYQIPQKEIDALLNNEDHHNLSKEEANDIILNMKRSRLRDLYFEQHPEKRDVYISKKPAIQTKQLCNDGGFEGATPLQGYSFFNYTETIAGFDSCNMPLEAGTPAIPPTSINDFNADYTIVNQGIDPELWSDGVSVRRTFNNSPQAIKLNKSSGGFDVTHMQRTFNINENNLSINFSLILENPAGHPSRQPFFRIRLYDANGNIFFERCIISDPNNCIFTAVGSTLYSDWRCINIDTQNLIGQNATLEFSIVDCGQAGHYGTVYIDEICNTTCTTSAFGDIQLDPVNLNCPTAPFQVCGSFLAPLCTTDLQSLTLDVIDQTGSVVNTLTNPVINQQTNQFCFTVDPSDFGANPVGNYEFEAIANFNTSTGFINTINDLSANVGPDVAFNNCPDPCEVIIPNIAIINAIDGCNATFTGSNNGTNCPNQTYLWEVFLDGNTTPVFTSTNTSFNETDFDFTQAEGNYVVQLTITGPTNSASTSINYSLSDDCYADPCIDDLNALIINQLTLTWDDIATSYDLQFASDNRCHDFYTDSSTEVTVSYNNLTTNVIDLNTVFNDLRALSNNFKGFRYRIRTNCGEWSDWCCIDITSGPISGLTYFETPYPDCFPGNSCDNFDPLATLVSPDNDVNSVSGDINYDTYVAITATNKIEATFTSNYRASNSIRLLPSFHAKDNSNFRAYIANCTDEVVITPPSGRSSATPQNEFLQEKNMGELSTVKLYPNPTKGNLTIESLEAIASWELINVYGNSIRKKLVRDESLKKEALNVSNLATGVYFVKITLKNGSVITKQLIKD
ncbi:T9SS type A sorting domain-containing protein [Kordia sp.]|uniref:T9SS type A sorting domain-containing protein n=1 Tax=Kordia sp. TaxID=1965332 RepID=UPI003D6AECA4